jgi:hypothetical protein
MIVYQTEHPDYGWVTHPTVDALMEAIRDEVEANNYFPDELTIIVKIVEMSQEEFDNLPPVE